MEQCVTITALHPQPNGALQSSDVTQPAVTLRKVGGELVVYVEGWPHGDGVDLRLPLLAVQEWLTTARSDDTTPNNSTTA